MTETLTANKPATTLLRLASGNGPVTRTVLTTPLRDALPSEIPIIDISGAFSDALADREVVAQQIRAAATTSGFFYIANHNIPASVTESAKAACLAFFRQPLEAKMQAHVGKSRYFNGYKPPGSQRINKSESVDARETFSWTYDPRFDPAAPPVEAIPPAPGGFLANEEAAAQGPSASANGGDGPAEVSIGSHTDFQLFTMLWQDDVGGLQVLNRDGQWIRASPVPGTFVVNIADYLQRITNDLYVSTVHRAVNRSGRERISMPFFFGFGLHESCAVIKSCLKDGEAPRYEEIGCDAWVKKRAQAMHKTDSDDEEAD
ncbi:gibberellin 3-beta-dioxygenase [Verticillium alfalfae VaMs.102]|uniref:Gibberellin 3-beta-dioxygenase n=1 Tax=Verticillium alfalfae (strain VaMs.102 / ATCC MYA-4576 / FGSC 10136) TaxID=526221 RepID=C9SRR0_VERA1|nr:gibberellin 3-beta-dioxygenase [Verticillium alfalfae VaMs.102]EEY21475.1 gibberellin 3-beta-dioxygenase [Verticillium alfalfae VaMs.102]